VLHTRFSACLIDEDVVHRPRSSRKKLVPALPAGIGFTHDFEIRLMNKSRRLERLSGRDSVEPGRSQGPKTVVHEREQTGGRPRITCFSSLQKFRDLQVMGITHGLQSIRSTVTGWKPRFRNRAYEIDYGSGGWGDCCDLPSNKHHAANRFFVQVKQPRVASHGLSGYLDGRSNVSSRRRIAVGLGTFIDDSASFGVSSPRSGAGRR